MKPPRELLQNAEVTLLKAVADYRKTGHSANAIEFYELRLQASIFHYEVTRQIVALWVLEPKGFALEVTLKDLVHKLYEYEEALSKRLVNRLMTLAAKRGLTSIRETLKAERKIWREEFRILRQWSNLRNEATGHYGKDIASQVLLISQLNREEVMQVAKAFLKFNILVNNTLAKIGAGQNDA